MTIQKPITLTAAEESFLAEYESAMGRLPGDAALVRARDAAVASIRKAGLPTRHNEAWHYTDLRSLLKSFPPLAKPSQEGARADAAAARERLVDSTRLPIFNGRFDMALADELPEGVTVDTLSAAPKPLPNNVIGALNTALYAESFEINVTPETTLEKPLGLAHIQLGQEPHSATSNVALHAGAASTMTVIERHNSPHQMAHFVNAISTLTLAKDAKVTWVIVQEQGDMASHLAQLNVVLHENAKFNLFILNAGSALVRQELNIIVEGEGADFQLRGMNLLGGATHCDVTMVLSHLPENTTSEQIVRNVVMDRAQGVFQGQIRVAKEAQKTDAKMACNTLLLSDDAGFSAKPELEIFADDVACGHGATVTEINPDHMFYLMARGVTLASARGLLVKAFVAELLEELENEAIAQALEARLDTWLKAHA